MFFFTLKVASLSFAVFLSSLAPVFLAIFSFLLFRENLSRVQYWAILTIVFSSVFLSTQSPNGGTLLLLEYSAVTVWVIGLAGALLSALAMLSLKTALNRNSSAEIVLWLSIVMTLFGFFTLNQNIYQAQSNNLLLWLLAMGLASLSGQLSMTAAYSYLSTQVANSLGRMILLFSALLDYLYFNTVFGPASLLFYGIASIAIIVLISAEVKATRGDDLSTDQKLKTSM